LPRCRVPEPLAAEAVAAVVAAAAPEAGEADRHLHPEEEE